MTSKTIEVINGMWKKHNHSKKKEGRKEEKVSEKKNEGKKTGENERNIEKTNSKV